MFPVSSAKERALAERLSELGITEADLEETFVRSRGSGGQNVNKVSTCVMLVHRPSGTAVRCELSRSQALNRFHARRLLADKIERATAGRVSAEAERVAKLRRQKRRRSRRAQEKVLDAKRARGETKSLRAAVRSDRES